MTMTRNTAILALFVAALAIQWIGGPHFVSLVNYIGLYAIVALGLVVLTGVTGQTSFGQAAFVGIAAYTTAVLATRYGANPFVTLACAVALTMGAALLLGLVTLGLSGHYLPLSTIAWGISLFYLFGNLDFLGGHTGIDAIPRLSLSGYELADPRALGALIWACLALALLCISNLLDSRRGRALRAQKDAAHMAQTFGVSSFQERLVAFVVAAALASISGWLYVYLVGLVNPSPFGLSYGIEYLFMAVVGGASHVWGAVVGSAIITVAREWLQDWLPRIVGSSGNFETIVFGLLVIALLHRTDQGIAARLAQMRWFRTTPVEPATEQKPSLPSREKPVAGRSLLEVRDLLKVFPGLTAVNFVSFDVRSCEIVGLIGPNGAGKSTAFNLISGTLALTGGTVKFDGEVISGLGPRQISAAGISRTFQHVEMMGEMSVLDNVMIGAHRRVRSGVLESCLRLERHKEAAIRAEAVRQIRRVGLDDVMHQQAASLPLGKQRILEIARALASDPILLILDEPAAGLRLPEKRQLYALLKQLRVEGLTILIVEHDMDFVMSLVDRLVVMNFGTLICEGAPDTVQNDRQVIEAYLGDAA
jgi:branched-chain amino acid transport system permease protein